MTLMLSYVTLTVVNRHQMSLMNGWLGQRWDPSHPSAKPVHFGAAPTLHAAAKNPELTIGNILHPDQQ